MALFVVSWSVNNILVTSHGQELAALLSAIYFSPLFATHIADLLEVLYARCVLAMDTRQIVRVCWDPVQGYRNVTYDFRCFYEHSPMIAAVSSYSTRMKKNVNVLLGCYVVLDIEPWLGGARRVKPTVAFAALLPLACTCRLWEAFVTTVNVNWQLWLDDDNPSTWFSSPRLRTLTCVHPPLAVRSSASPVLLVSECTRPIFPAIFEAPCPLDCQSYAVPRGHAPTRCGAKCCHGNLFVHPSPRHFHTALRKLHLASMGTPASIVPSALTDPECGLLAGSRHRGLHPAPQSLHQDAPPRAWPSASSGVRRPIWNNALPPPVPKWPFLPTWSPQPNVSVSPGTWYPPPPPPPPLSEEEAPPSQIEICSQSDTHSPRSKKSKRVSGHYVL